METIPYTPQEEPKTMQDLTEEEFLSELCKGCTNTCSVCMVWKEHEGIPVD